MKFFLKKKKQFPSVLFTDLQLCKQHGTQSLWCYGTNCHFFTFLSSVKRLWVRIFLGMAGCFDVLMLAKLFYLQFSAKSLKSSATVCHLRIGDLVPDYSLLETSLKEVLMTRILCFIKCQSNSQSFLSIDVLWKGGGGIAFRYPTVRPFGFVFLIIWTNSCTSERYSLQIFQSLGVGDGLPVLQQSSRFAGL